MQWEPIVKRAAAPVAVVALIAGIVSYTHIVSLSLSTGAGWPSYLLPFAVDGLIAAGVVILLAGSMLGWLCVAPGIVATLFANVMSGWPHGYLAAAVAAWPAAAFALASFTLERWLKSRARPAVTTGAACGHVVATTLDETVVTAFLHGRDCLGEVPSQRQLASTYNVSRPRVAELIGSLNGHGEPGVPAAAGLPSRHDRKHGRRRPGADPGHTQTPAPIPGPPGRIRGGSQEAHYGQDQAADSRRPARPGRGTQVPGPAIGAG